MLRLIFGIARRSCGKRLFRYFSKSGCKPANPECVITKKSTLQCKDMGRLPRRRRRQLRAFEACLPKGLEGFPQLVRGRGPAAGLAERSFSNTGAFWNPPVWPRALSISGCRRSESWPQKRPKTDCSIAVISAMSDAARCRHSPISYGLRHPPNYINP